MSKTQEFYAITVDANLDGENLLTRIGVVDVMTMAGDCIAEGWKMVPTAIEVNENFYNIIFIMPTYLDDVIVADISLPAIMLYCNENLSDITKCMVSHDKLRQLSNNMQTNIFGDEIDKE